MPTLQSTAKETGVNSRIVMLSSFAHNFASLIPKATPDFSSLETANRPFAVSGNWARYAQVTLPCLDCTEAPQSKIADHLLARKYNDLEGITSCSVHPGFVASDLYKSTYMRAFLSTFITVCVMESSSALIEADPRARSPRSMPRPRPRSSRSTWAARVRALSDHRKLTVRRPRAVRQGQATDGPRPQRQAARRPLGLVRAGRPREGLSVRL